MTTNQTYCKFYSTSYICKQGQKHVYSNWLEKILSSICHTYKFLCVSQSLFRFFFIQLSMCNKNQETSFVFITKNRKPRICLKLDNFGCLFEIQERTGNVCETLIPSFFLDIYHRVHKPLFLSSIHENEIDIYNLKSIGVIYRYLKKKMYQHIKYDKVLIRIRFLHVLDIIMIKSV